jgi:mono/diheme cytochrome c family protein
MRDVMIHRPCSKPPQVSFPEAAAREATARYFATPVPRIAEHLCMLSSIRIHRTGATWPRPLGCGARLNRRNASIVRRIMGGIVRKMPGTARHFIRLIAAITGLWIAMVGTHAIAQVAPGETEYRNDCAVCHGPTGKGDGEAVTVLPALKPSDLTQLSKKNGGQFPTQEVYQAIDGRDDVAAHHLGDRRMPTWGTNWQIQAGEPNPTSEANVHRRIEDLIAFIKTLQQR